MTTIIEYMAVSMVTILIEYMTTLIKHATLIQLL